MASRPDLWDGVDSLTDKQRNLIKDDAVRQVQKGETCPQKWRAKGDAGNGDDREASEELFTEILNQEDVKQEVQMNEEKLEDHSIDALVLLGLSNEIRAHNMLAKWVAENPKKGWWRKLWSTDVELKLSASNFHFAEIRKSRSWLFMGQSLNHLGFNRSPTTTTIYHPSPSFTTTPFQRKRRRSAQRGSSPSFGIGNTCSGNF
jgi:hypothetical protein